MRTRALLPVLILAGLSTAAIAGCPAAPPHAPQRGRATLATFTLRERIGHRSADELIHFDFDVATGSADLGLYDEAGGALPAQIEVRAQKDGRVSGSVWTVVSLAPYEVKRFELREGKATVEQGVAAFEDGSEIVLSNDRMAIALPRWLGPAGGMKLAALPAPLRAVRGIDGSWACEARWVNDGPVLGVREATTRVIEAGPVRARVEQRLTLDDGRTYEAVVTLAARQDAAIVIEDSDIAEPKAGYRISMRKGLTADHAFWQTQWKAAGKEQPWALLDEEVKADKEQPLFKMRPWSFWWYPRIAEWAGFYRKGAEPFVGVMMMRPSRWSPHDWDGHDQTEIPVIAGPRAGIEVVFPLAAMKGRPLHREWAITAGTVSEHVTTVPSKAKLRLALARTSELPLDEVKDYGFDFDPPAGEPARLFMGPLDIERARRQARSEPAAKARVEKAIAYLDGCGGLHETLKNEGPEAFYKRYVGHFLVEALPEAYLGSADAKYGEMLAAVVKGLAAEIPKVFLEEPSRPAIGAYGPWFSETVTALLTMHDLIAGAGLLTAQEEARIRDVKVFAAHVMAHPDYWNPARGLASANPNMSSSILLPRGLLGLALRGHPEADGWLSGAEAELTRELAEWVSPGGAWVENPYYQTAALDGMMMLAQAIQRAGGKDPFGEERFKETMDYFGFLLTPPDRRFPPGKAGKDAPMVLPSIGNAFSGFVTPFNGWMAAATARSDPAFSARQQFFWRQQRFAYHNVGRAKGLLLGIADPALPARAPDETSRAFPGFGSVMRSSWADPDASYVAHRTGPNVHHYEHDQGSFVYYAKGAPLCLDWGNYFNPVARSETYYHNLVSFHVAGSPRYLGSNGRLVELRTLPHFVDASHGETAGHGGQRSRRRILLVKSNDALGANYVVVRDTTEGAADQRFYWNLWCLSGELKFEDRVAHFPGQMGVDLDAHVLSPRSPSFETDRWSWRQPIPVWGDFSEEQRALRIAKTGPAEDFFVVLHPRAKGQRAARIEATRRGEGLRIAHEEGTDWLLHAPGKAAFVEEGDVRLEGGVAIARKYKGGVVRLMVVEGDRASARVGGWAIESSGPVGVEIVKRRATGESDGAARAVRVTTPKGFGEARVTVDGRETAARREGGAIVIDLPAGPHTFAIEPR